MPNAKNNSANSTKAPPTTKPAITPPLSDDPLELFPLEEFPELPVSSMTLCRTHSPNEHPDKLSPEDPKSDCSTLCLKSHCAVLVVLFGGSQEMPRVPSKPFIVAVRLVVGTAPQNV